MAEGSSRGGEGPWFHEEVERLIAEGKTYEAVRELESRLEIEDPVQIVRAAFALSEAGQSQVARRAMEAAAVSLREGSSVGDRIPFDQMRSVVGWPEYDRIRGRYEESNRED